MGIRLGLACSIVLGVLALSPTANAATQPAAQVASSGTPNIVAVGVGTAQGKPDVAELSLGVSTQAAKASDALSQNADAVNGLVQVLHAAGIKDVDITTEGLSLQPHFDVASSSINGYDASNFVSVRIHDLTKVGSIVDSAAQKVNDKIRINGISFSLDDTSRVLGKARANALTNARRHAQQFATASGVKLGKTLTISEAQVSVGTSAAAPQAVAAAPASTPTTVFSGSQPFTASVTVVYATKR